MEPYIVGYSDHVRRPVVEDAEGIKHQTIRYTSGHNTEGYLMKAERIVEHTTYVAPVVSLVTKYRYGSKPVDDHKRYAQLGSAYDHPEKMEDIATEVQTAVSQPTQVSLPFSSTWRARPNSNGQDGTAKYGDDRELIKGSDQNKLNSNVIRDKQNDGNPQIYKGTNPMINSKGPKGNEGSIVPSHQLSKPTNDIGSAVEFLTEAVKPMYVTNTQTDASRPIKGSSLRSTHWRTGSNLAAQDRKVDSDENDWEMPKEDQMYGKDKIANHQEPTNQINNKQGNERPNGNGSATYFGKPAAFSKLAQQPRFTAPTKQNKEIYSSHETIDSNQARDRYGKLKSQPVPEDGYIGTIEDGYIGTIDSNDFVRKYNGTKVP